MMKFLFDLFPIILFFLVYKFFGNMPPELFYVVNQIPYININPNDSKDAIYLATLVLIFATIIQNLLHYIIYAQFEKLHVVSLAILLVFGSIALLLKSPSFIVWKVTIFNWFFALLFLGSQFIGDKTLTERMMGNAIKAPNTIWLALNGTWIAFFFTIGLINLYIAYNFPKALWVEFKVFGVLGLTFILMIGQIIYLQSYIKNPTAKPTTDNDKTD